MSAREWIFAVLLLVAGSVAVAGVAEFHGGAAKIAAGVLMAGAAWLLLGDVE